MIERLRGLLAGVSFQRGLALGALVGSAIAGSTIWKRLREARSDSQVQNDSVTGPAGSPSEE